MNRTSTSIILAFLVLLISAFLGLCGSARAESGTVLILVDGQADPAHASTSQRVLENLLGHFDLCYEAKPVTDYVAGDTGRYRATFYIGSEFDRELPAAFIDDMLTSSSPIVWINYNIWKPAWDRQQQFEDRFGFRVIEEIDSGSRTKISYNRQSLARSQGDICQLKILNGAKAKTVATATGGRALPYVVRSGDFWYVADDPLSQQSEDSPYLAFCDLLHDMLGVQHAASHRALVRIEDIDAYEDPARIRAIADYLYSQKVPFSLAVIPRFSDPLGVWGPPGSIDISSRPEVVAALKYAVSRGGTIIQHGYTHQYGSVANPDNGVSGVDSEFFIQSHDPASGELIDVGPVPEDSEAWVKGRIDAGRGILRDAGFAEPRIWETPHYLASYLDYGVFATNYTAGYERLPFAYFPYPIDRSEFGGRLLPENLGYMAAGTELTPRTLINRAGKNLVVRDGFASFFYHSEEDIRSLKSTVAGIKSKGYTFVDVSSLLPGGAAQGVGMAR